jgi:hypothetical protein
MTATTGITYQWKQDILKAAQNMSSDTFYWALYTSTGTNGPATTAYTTTNEISGTGYTAGGASGGSGTVSLQGTSVATVDFSNVSWTGASFTAENTLLYDHTNGSKDSVAVWDFGGNQTVSGATFTLTMPASGSSTSLIRIS